MKKVLITGANGFAGSHLIDYILTLGSYKVFGVLRSRLSDKQKIAQAIDNPNFSIIECDLTQQLPIANAIKNVKPDFIFHLAAQSFVPDSWKDPHQTVETNILGIVNILEAVRLYSPESKIFVCGSAEEYGYVPSSEGPIKEERPLDPNNPYGVTKVAQELYAKVAFESYGLNVCLVRPFAHEGPRRGREFATSDFALQTIAIERGLRKEPIIYYGNLETVRDYIHITDIVKMYWELMHKFKPGQVYNVCTGNTTNIGQLINKFIEVSGIKDIRLEKNNKLVRPTQASYLVGDPTKIFSVIDYRPKLKLEDICKDMLSYWREKFESLPYWKD